MCQTPQVLANREVPIPDHLDLYHLSEEVAPTERTALETVVDYIKDEITRLNRMEEHIMTEYGPEDERLQVGLRPRYGVEVCQNIACLVKLEEYIMTEYGREDERLQEDCCFVCSGFGRRGQACDVSCLAQQPGKN